MCGAQHTDSRPSRTLALAPVVHCICSTVLVTAVRPRLVRTFVPLFGVVPRVPPKMEGENPDEECGERAVAVRCANLVGSIYA
jgi:hypothetical protein